LLSYKKITDIDTTHVPREMIWFAKSTGSSGACQPIHYDEKEAQQNKHSGVKQSIKITGYPGYYEQTQTSNISDLSNIDQFKVAEVSLYGETTKSKDNNLVLNVGLNGKSVNALIDTAAQMTVINEEFAKSLQPSPNTTERIILNEVGKDNNICARYAEKNTINIGQNRNKMEGNSSKYY